MEKTFLQDVKTNCDISDARFWGYFSICGLLMRYRDLYRTEQGLDPWSPVRREEIGPWISAKESRWPELESQALTDLRLNRTLHRPFDLAGINQALRPEGYVYGAGYGVYLKPTFFIARIKSIIEESGHRVYTTDREVVRDLFSAPAMLQDRTIFLRLDPLRALLWDKFVQLRPGTAMAEAFLARGIEPGQLVNEAFAKKLDNMAQSYLPVLLKHELAESRESALTWKDIIAKVYDRGAEHFLRAVQDLIADTSDSGPLAWLVDSREAGGLALYAGLLEGHRRLLFPEIRDAEALFREKRDWSLIDDTRRQGNARFLDLRREILDLHEQCGRDDFLTGIRLLAGRREKRE